MTHDFDEIRLLRRALLCAAEADLAHAMETTLEAPLPSHSYRKWEKRFLKDPAKLSKHIRRPRWQYVLRTAVCLLLVVSLSFSVFWAASPQARAIVSRWVTQWFGNHVSYSFQGTAPSANLGCWGATYLPEGYAKTDEIRLPGVVSVLYNNGAPEMEIELCYEWLAEGSGFSLDNEHHLITDITVNDMPAHLLTATNGSQNMLVWFDESSGHGFLLMSRVSCDTLIMIAESVKEMD